MKCPTCGEVNEGGYRFCRVCGHPLSVEEVESHGGHAHPNPAAARKPSPSGCDRSCLLHAIALSD